MFRREGVNMPSGWPPWWDDKGQGPGATASKSVGLNGHAGSSMMNKWNVDSPQNSSSVFPIVSCVIYTTFSIATYPGKTLNFSLCSLFWEGS